jgi:TRAP transporter TAXI family solute receptor
MGDQRRAAATRRILCTCALAISTLILPTDHALSDRLRTAREASETIGPLVNSNTISIVSGSLNGTYLSIAYDLSAVLDDGDNLRVLPVVGKGGGQNIRDVRFLKGIDLGITQSNILRLYRRSNEIGPIDDRIVYVARLFNEEMHVVVRADSPTAIEQLAGKTVNFSEVGSGTQLAARDIFSRLGIEVTEINMGRDDALAALKRGEIAATVLVDGKPTGSISRLRAEDGFRILPVRFGKALQDDYLPATLTNADYPGLIEAGRGVDTVAAAAVLIAYNWPPDTERYRRIAKFIEAFFPRMADFQKSPRHPKWRETDLSATVAGWKRFAAAEEWLERNRSLEAEARQRREFARFLARNGTQEAASSGQREELFQEFLKWSRTHEPR